MSIASIVSDFETMGVYLWVENDQLKFKAPSGVMNDGHKQQLKSHKEELIAFLADPVFESITPDPQHRYDPFPLTDLQLAYLVGRNNVIEYGGVGCHSYIELDLPSTDLKRLQHAWHQLIARHDMLRATITQEGYQRILADVCPPPIIHHDYRQQPERQVNQEMTALRKRLAHRCYQPDQWPQYEMHLSSTDQGAVLHFSIDLLIADFASIQILLAELGELYNHPERPLAPLGISYRDVVLARKSIPDNPKAAERYEQHKAYWLERIDSLPLPPELPLAAQSGKQDNNGTVNFQRRDFELTELQWQALCQKAMSAKLTPSGVVLSAFTEVISRWSRHPEFCLNLTMLNRSTAHPDIRGVVGDFIEVNVLGVNHDAEKSFASRVLSLQQQLWRDLEHTDFSGIDVLREMSRQRQSNIIVPIVYTSTIGLSGDDLDANEFMHHATLRYGITQTPQVWLDCQATERNGKLIINWDIRSGVFQDGIIEAAHTAFCQLMQHLANSDTPWMSKTPVSLPLAMQQRHEQLNNTAAPLPQDHLHTGFCRHALRNPKATAIISGDQKYSYIELAKHALSISSALEAQINSGDRVAIVMDKSFHQIAAVLGTLMADATYIPIEGSQPKARRDTIITDAEATVVLTESHRLDTSWPDAVKVLTVDQLPPLTDEDITQQLLNNTVNQHQQNINVTAEKTAYIIYTSGTTGHPKGVMVAHRAAMNTVSDINKRFAINAKDNVLGLVSFGFDLSIWDIFGSFTAGASLILPQEEKRSDPNHWVEIMAQHKVTLWNSVPAQMQMLITCLEWQPALLLEDLRLTFLSGDWIPVALPDTIRQRLPKVQVISLGGPTETSIWCVSHSIGEVPADAYSIPYGRPMTNHQIHILNKHLQSCPDWVSGEMYIGGAGLAQGYTGDLEKTSERFIEHPQTGERLYRSGDIGRYSDDGLIEIQGREDNQVKINGHRIELGEIEAAICADENIESAALITLATGNTLALVAAAVPKTAISKVTTEHPLIDSILNQLKQQLPAYMIPVSLTLLPELPLSNNSKLDRKTLQAMLADKRQSNVFTAPLDTDLEQKVLSIWRKTLGIEKISRHDDFFQLGGSSLSAINLLSAYLAEGYSADIDLIFNNPVFGDMTTALAESNTAKAEWLASIDLAQMATNALSGIKQATAFNQQAPIKTILLTGATGFLGSYLLNRLLADSNYHIYCLLRCHDPANGITRLKNAALEKGLNTDLDTSRLTIISGELSQPRLGISDTDYQHLSETVDAIIHNASIINLMDPLSALYPTNVEGVWSILELASTAKIKPINYISTIGVHHALPENTSQPVAEATSVVDWHDVELTYEQSKIMAETLFGHARQQGLPVNILRPGTITWETGEQAFINDDAFLKFYRACLNMKSYPSSDLAINIVPVDYVADCIVAISRAATGGSNNYHIAAGHSSQVDDMYSWFVELGCQFEALPFETWRDTLKDNFVLSFVDLYFRGGMEGGGGHHQYATSNLQEILNNASIAPFEVTKGYLQLLTRQFNNASYKS